MVMPIHNHKEHNHALNARFIPKYVPGGGGAAADTCSVAPAVPPPSHTVCSLPSSPGRHRADAPPPHPAGGAWRAGRASESCAPRPAGISYFLHWEHDNCIGRRRPFSGDVRRRVNIIQTGSTDGAACGGPSNKASGDDVTCSRPASDIIFPPAVSSSVLLKLVQCGQ